MVEPMQSTLVEVSRILSETCGLRMGHDKLPVLTEVVSTRMRARGTLDAARYLELLSDDVNELAEVARAIAVPETYFLRDARQFAAFAALLRERATRGLAHVRILSAGCSTGEEAYSIAITLRETLPDVARWSIDVLGIDLNARSLATARRGRYTPWSLRETPDAIRRKYFTKHGSDYVLTPEITAMVRFEQHNLASSRVPGRPGGYDVVFFRNVLMYMREEAARAAIESVVRSMAPGAHLFLGHAENLRGLSQRFQLLHARETFYYRLHEREGAHTDVASSTPQQLERGPAPTDWFAAITRASARIDALSVDSRDTRARDWPRPAAAVLAPQTPPSSADGVERVLSLVEAERFDDAFSLLGSISGAEQAQVGLLRAVLQLSTGKLDAALAECAHLLELDDLNAEAHFVTALCCEHQGEADKASEHARTASYLDHDFAMPHLQLGRLARRSGDLPTARRELKLALELLMHETPVRIVLFGGGFDRNALRNVCRGELSACGVQP